MRGFIIRKRFNSFAKLYFLFRRYARHSEVKEISGALRDCFVHVKSVRKRLLEAYVNKQATTIQRVFRGWYVRERAKPLGVLKTLSGRGVLSKIRAVIAGWRLRRIL